MSCRSSHRRPPMSNICLNCARRMRNKKEYQKHKKRLSCEDLMQSAFDVGEFINIWGRSAGLCSAWHLARARQRPLFPSRFISNNQATEDGFVNFMQLKIAAQMHFFPSLNGLLCLPSLYAVNEIKFLIIRPKRCTRWGNDNNQPRAHFISSKLDTAHWD